MASRTVSFESRRAKRDERETIPQAPELRRSADVGVLERLWCAVLKVAEVQPSDDFFELGGTSLHAMLIAARLDEEYNAELSLVDFFDNPTFNGLCNAVTVSHD
jgi:acyl carrier protein